MSQDYKTAIQWGVIGGLGTAIFRFIIYFISPLSVSTWENAYYIPLLFCMVWGAVTIKRDRGGEISFGDAFLVILVISIIGAYIDSFTAYALFNWIDPDLRDKVYRLALQQAEDKWEKQGLSDEQQQAAREWMNKVFNSKWVMPALVGFQTLVSVIFSLIIAAFVKRSSNQIPVFPDQNQNPNG